LVSIFWATANMLAHARVRFLCLFTLAAAPVLTHQVTSVMSELPFAAVLLGLAVTLSCTTSPLAWWLAALLTVTSLCIRYAGVISFIVLLSWSCLAYKSLTSPRLKLHAMLACGSACFFGFLLLAINWFVSGSISGAERGAADGITYLPHHLSDFGWSISSALAADGVRAIGMQWTAAHTAIGVFLFCGLTALFLRSWFKPLSKWDRPLALIGISYAVGIVVLRCVGDFDPLYNARTFLPALAPTFILGCLRIQSHPRILAGLLGVLLITGISNAIRGASRQIGGDVRPALSLLRDHLKANDIIAINDHAFALTAYLSNRTKRVWAADWSKDTSVRFLVIAGEPQNRRGFPDALPSTWQIACRSQIESGQFHSLINSSQLIVLERVHSAR